MKKTLLIVLLLMFGCVMLLSSCDNVANQQTPEKNHTCVFGEWEITKNATCTIEGEKERYCSCGEKEVQSISLTEHIEVIDEALSATCTVDGKTEGKHCSVCNTIIVAQTTVKAKGHTKVTDKAVAVTCTKTGLTEGKHCSVCNTVTVAQTTVPITHQYSDATCNEPMKCTQCGQTYGLAEGHSFNGSYCSSCGGYLYDIFNYTYSTGSYLIGDRNYTYGTTSITNCSKTYYKYNNSLTLSISVKGTISAVHPGTSGTAHYKVCLYKDGVLVDSKSCSVTGKKGASSTSSVSFYNVTPGNCEIKIVRN